MKARTSTYRFSVRMINGKVAPEDQAAVDGLRTVVKLGNIAFDATNYVKLQGRGPRKVNGRKYFQSLPLQFAERADVYVYERY